MYIKLFEYLLIKFTYALYFIYIVLCLATLKNSISSLQHFKEQNIIIQEKGKKKLFTRRTSFQKEIKPLSLMHQLDKEKNTSCFSTIYASHYDFFFKLCIHKWRFTINEFYTLSATNFQFSNKSSILLTKV